MRRALGLTSGFPSELALGRPIHIVVDYERAKVLGKRLTKHTIYVTPSDTFSVQFRDIFIDIQK